MKLVGRINRYFVYLYYRVRVARKFEKKMNAGCNSLRIKFVNYCIYRIIDIFLMITNSLLSWLNLIDS